MAHGLALLQVLTHWFQQFFFQLFEVCRVLQQSVGHRGQLRLSVVAPQHIGHPHRGLGVCTGQPQGTAGHGDFAQVEPLARSACAALHHHQTRFGFAQPLGRSATVRVQGTVQQALRRSGQQSHPLGTGGGPLHAGIVK